MPGVLLGFALTVLHSERAGGLEVGPGLAEHFEHRIHGAKDCPAPVNMNTLSNGHADGMPMDPAPCAPDFDAEIDRWVLDDATQLGSLRASMLRSISSAPALDGRELDETAEKMLIVVTELAGNALRHALPPTIVLLRRSGPDFLIDVVDHDPTSSPRDSSQHRYGGGGGGLGLVLARALALDVGWYTTATTKHVWARFPTPGS